MSLPKPGWFVFERKHTTLAHYVIRPNETLRPALCRARLSLKVWKDRRWNVCQDVGRIALCEDCKARLRAA